MDTDETHIDSIIKLNILSANVIHTSLYCLVQIAKDVIYSIDQEILKEKTWHKTKTNNYADVISFRQAKSWNRLSLFSNNDS